MMIKKQLKKIFCMILSIAMIVGSSIPALAAEPDVPAYSVTISEYDVYVSTRTATKASTEPTTPTITHRRYATASCPATSTRLWIS